MVCNCLIRLYRNARDSYPTSSSLLGIQIIYEVPAKAKRERQTTSKVIHICGALFHWHHNNYVSCLILRGEIMRTQTIQSPLNILSLTCYFGNFCGTEPFSWPTKYYHWDDLLLKQDEIAWSVPAELTFKSKWWKPEIPLQASSEGGIYPLEFIIFYDNIPSSGWIRW